MKYVLHGNINFVIDLNYEILSILQKTARPESEWISFVNEKYVNKIKSNLNMNSKEIINILDLFKKYDFPFGEIRSYCDLMDEDYNIMLNYKKHLEINKNNLQNYNMNFEKIKEFESACKSLFNSINYNDIYDLLKEESYLYLSEIKEVFDKDEYKNRLINFYGKQLGNFEIICSFVAGNFGSLVNGKQIFVRKFKITEDNHIKLNATATLPFYFHEFSHPYVTELLNKYREEIIDFDTHFKSLTLSKEMSPYSKAMNYLNEILTRANETYLCGIYIPDMIDLYINKQINYGITYFKDLVELIANNIDNYQNYEGLFIDKMIPFINSLSKK